MTNPEQRPSEREIAASLVRALVRALAPGAPAGALAAARDAAQMLLLPGLDRVLQALEPHAGSAWPGELVPVLGRLERVAAQCGRAGDLAPFRNADRELSGLASELEAIEWSGAGDATAGPAGVATLGAADVLGDLTVEDAGVLRGVRLLPPVAAALRAALDWLAGENGPRRPLRVAAGEGVLEVTCEAAHPAGLHAAHDVIAAVGGNLGPVTAARDAAAPPGGTRVRVPAFGSHRFFLMVHQGGIPLALPWHAVLRVHVAGAAELETRAGESAGVTLLPPLVPTSGNRGDRPVVLLGHGLKRAYLVADRLVWRLAADPCPAPGPAPAPDLEETVRTEEGETYWLADPARLLAAAPLPPLPEAPAAPAAPAPAAASAPAPRSPRTPPSSAPPTRSASHLRVLEARDVEALALEVGAARATPPHEVGPQSLAAIAESAAPAPTARRALVAEDSLTARMFLSRMLEQHGFEVQTVTRGSELLKQLERGPWSLLCVDVELPDAAGSGPLREVAARARAPLIALVRDRQDIRTAAEAGISRVLRKPFDADVLRVLVERLVPARSRR